MVLPPTDQLVCALDLRRELCDIVAVGEKSGDLEKGIRITNAAKCDRDGDTIARSASHLGRDRCEVHLRFAKRIGEQIDRITKPAAEHLSRPPQLLLSLGAGEPSKVRMTVGVRSDVHAAGAKFMDLCPIERDEIIGSATPQALKPSKDLRLALDEAGSNEERRRHAVLCQYRQSMRVVVLVPVIEGDCGDRFAVARPRICHELDERDQLAMLLEPLNVA